MSTEPDQELNDLARALGKLVPQTPNLQRDRLLFDAGRRSGRRIVHLQSAANIALLSLCVFLGYRFWSLPTPAREVRIVTVHVPQPMPIEQPTVPVDEVMPDIAPPNLRPLPPVIVGNEHPPTYGTIQRNIPHYGDRALPYLPSVEGKRLVAQEPTRAGSRPGFAESLVLTFPWR